MEMIMVLYCILIIFTTIHDCGYQTMAIYVWLPDFLLLCIRANTALGIQNACLQTDDSPNLGGHWFILPFF